SHHAQPALTTRRPGGCGRTPGGSVTRVTTTVFDDSAVAPHQGTGVEQLPKVVAVLKQGIAERMHPGCQVFVARGDDGVIADFALGYARPNTPMTTESMITWFSMTKATVAVSVAQQWERGAIELDDPIAKYVPEFAAKDKG